LITGESDTFHAKDYPDTYVHGIRLVDSFVEPSVSQINFLYVQGAHRRKGKQEQILALLAVNWFRVRM
jgi:hypothetical protein